MKAIIQDEWYSYCVATIHISESEAVRDFSALMAKVRVGTDFVIESDSGVIAVVRPPETEFRPRLVSDCIAEEQALENVEGDAPVFDAEFEDDLAEIIRSRRPWNPPPWD